MEFTNEGFTLFIEKSKTDQLREGNTIFISKFETQNCPSKWLSRYLEISDIKNPEDFLICRLEKCKAGHRAIGYYKISYATALENLRKILPKHNDPETIATHSLRAGGASRAANKGISDRMISKHGRWATGNSRDRYIKDSHESRYNISKKMCL